MKKTRHLRWYILALTFFATIINYIDRNAWNITQPVVGKLYHLNNEQLALIVSAFSIGYIVGPVPMGWLMDRLGSRKGYSVSMAFWSFAGILTAAAIPIGLAIRHIIPVNVLPVILGFAFCRFLLGVGESGNWPVAIKCISE